MKKKVTKVNSSLAEPLKSKPVAKAVPPREQGRTMGSAFSRLNGAERQRTENMVTAVQRGFSEARERDELQSVLSQDNDFLESMGFGKPGR